MSSSLTGKHVILSCDHTCHSLAEAFLEEFFHEVCSSYSCT
jgi:hypothetical protein